MVQRTMGEASARNDLLAAVNEAYGEVERLERERDEARKQAQELRAQLAQLRVDFDDLARGTSIGPAVKSQAAALVADAHRERDDARDEAERLMALLDETARSGLDIGWTPRPLSATAAAAERWREGLITSKARMDARVAAAAELAARTEIHATEADAEEAGRKYAPCTCTGPAGSEHDPGCPHYGPPAHLSVKEWAAKHTEVRGRAREIVNDPDAQERAVQSIASQVGQSAAQVIADIAAAAYTKPAPEVPRPGDPCPFCSKPMRGVWANTPELGVSCMECAYGTGDAFTRLARAAQADVERDQDSPVAREVAALAEASAAGRIARLAFVVELSDGKVQTCIAPRWPSLQDAHAFVAGMAQLHHRALNLLLVVDFMREEECR